MDDGKSSCQSIIRQWALAYIALVIIRQHRHSAVSQLSRDLYCRPTVGLLFNHRLRGSASPVLTATHHSYGSPRLSNLFPSRLWGSDPQRTVTQNGSNDVFSRKDVPFAVKIATFHTLKGQNLAIFRSIWPLTIEVTERTLLILHRSPMKVTY